LSPPEPDGGRDLDLVVVGDCNPDVIVTGSDVTPAFGQRERLVDGMSLVIGGSASITAVAAARLGLRVALVAAVGDDAAGELMLSLLRREGVDTSAVAIRPGVPTGMTTVLSRGADRAILTALGAMPTLAAADVPADVLGRARHLHVSSYFLLESSLGPGLAGLLGAARALGVRTSLDTNDDPSGRWGGSLLRAVLAETDLFLPNESEALAISGQADLASAVAELGRMGPGVIVKLGARGALFLAAERAAVRVAFPPVEPADTTGAGDCFNAGLIAGLLRGLPLPDAVALACAVGAASTQAPGGTGAPLSMEAALAAAASASHRVIGRTPAQSTHLKRMPPFRPETCAGDAF
jgi:sugar/nucleoside kinase (ribokinase family)